MVILAMYNYRMLFRASVQWICSSVPPKFPAEDGELSLLKCFSNQNNFAPLLIEVLCLLSAQM